MKSLLHYHAIAQACASTDDVPPRSGRSRPALAYVMNPGRYCIIKRVQVIGNASGSAYYEQGNTKVIASVFGPHEVSLLL